MSPPLDHTLALRKAIVKKLLAAGSATRALVSTRVYGQKSPADPTYPFVRYGAPLTSSFEAQRREGSEHSILIHAFADGPGEDKCANLAAAIVADLNTDDLPLEGLGLVGIQWEQTQVIVDPPRTDGWHGLIRFRATTSNEVTA